MIVKAISWWYIGVGAAISFFSLMKILFPIMGIISDFVSHGDQSMGGSILLIIISSIFLLAYLSFGALLFFTGFALLKEKQWARNAVITIGLLGILVLVLPILRENLFQFATQSIYYRTVLYVNAASSIILFFKRASR